MKNLIGLLIVFAAALHCANGLAGPELDPKLLKAQEFESKGDIERAQETYLELYNAEKLDLYFYKLITLYSGSGDFDGLMAITSSKLGDQPDHTEAKRYLARAYYGRGESQKGYETLLSIIGGNWKDIQKVRIAANELMARNDYKEAVHIYKTAREKLGNPNLFAIELARLHVSREDYVAAVEEYLKVLDAVKFAYANTQKVLDSAVAADIDIAAPAKLIEDYLIKKPDSINAAKLLSGLLYRAGNVDQAYGVLFRTAVRTESAQDVWNLAGMLRRDGHTERALQTYRDYYEYFKKAPNIVEALKTSASIERELGRADRAIGDYQRIIDNHPGTIHSADAGLRLIELSAGRTSFEGYARILEEYSGETEFREVAFEGYFILGDTYLRHGMTEQAGAAFGSAILKTRTVEERYKVYMKTAYLRFFENDIEMMSDAVQSCMGNVPGGEDINELLAFKILGLKCASSADKSAFQAFSQGHYALYRGDASAAREHFSAASADTSSVVAPHALSELGKMSRARGNFTEAADFYLSAAESARDTTVQVGAVVEAADIFAAELNDNDRAKALYLETITSFPGTIFEHELRNKLRVMAE
jgi:tetratricopeptide (TPR) repeat protein